MAIGFDVLATRNWAIETPNSIPSQALPVRAWAEFCWRTYLTRNTWIGGKSSRTNGKVFRLVSLALNARAAVWWPKLKIEDFPDDFQVNSWMPLKFICVISTESILMLQAKRGGKKDFVQRAFPP
jgi:hypothetical protein